MQPAKPRADTIVIAVAALAAIVSVAAIVRSHGVIQPLPELVAPPGPEHERDLVEESCNWIDCVEGPPDLGEQILDANQLSIGNAVRVFAPGWPFVAVDYASDLSEGLTPLNDWVAPLFHDGQPVCLIHIRGDTATSHYALADVLPEDFDTGLLALDPHERLLYADRFGWYLARGESLTPLGWTERGFAHDETSLDSLRDSIATWRLDEAYPGRRSVRRRPPEPMAPPDAVQHGDLVAQACEWLRCSDGPPPLAEALLDKSSLTLGSFARIHTPGWPYYRVTRDTDLATMIIPDNEWLAPLRYGEEVIGAVEVWVSGSVAEGYYVAGVLDQAAGRRLAAIMDGDQVVRFYPQQSWFIRSGDSIVSLEGPSSGSPPDPRPLSTLRDSIVEWSRWWEGFPLPMSIALRIFDGLQDIFDVLSTVPGMVLAGAMATMALTVRRRRRTPPST